MRETRKWRGILSLLLIILLLTGQFGTPVPVKGAADYSFDNGILTIRTNAATTAWRNDASIDKAAVVSIVLDSGVSSIGSSAFQDCTSLVSITIPGNVTEINQYAFRRCTSLTNLTLENGLDAIGSGAFQNCTSLASVDLPSSVRIVAFNAFNSCISLTQINLPSGNSTFQSIDGVLYQDNGRTLVICPNGKAGDFVIPSGVTTIANNSFQYCAALTGVTIPDTVTAIGNSAFYGCTGLGSIIIPGTVNSIGNYTFQACTGLNNITISDGVASIGTQAFFGCENLTSVTLPKTVTSIGNQAFKYCYLLTEINAEPGNTVYQSIDGVLYSNSGQTLSFYPTGKQGSFVIPDGVTAIGDYAFDSCTSLTDVTLPQGLTTIEASAFYNCGGLIGAVIPDTITSIKSNSFAYCASLTAVIMESASAPPLESGAFSNTRNLIIYIPQHASGYDTGQWASLQTQEYSPTDSLTLYQNILELEPGKTVNLTPQPQPGNAVPVVLWKSSDSKVATVDQFGRITARGEGTAIITASSLQNKSKTDTCTVKVQMPSSGGNHFVAVPQAPKTTDIPVKALVGLPLTVKKGTAAGTTDDAGTAAALAEAFRDPRAGQNGIAVWMNAETSRSYSSFSILLKRITLDRLVTARVKYLTLSTDVMDLTFDFAALQEIAAQSSGDLTFSAVKETVLTGDMKSAVGSRPAYQLTVSCTLADGRTATVDSFGKGQVTVGLAYEPGGKEQTGSLYLVRSDSKGRVEWLNHSGYVRNSGNVTGSAGHFSLYGVGYRPAPAFTDTRNHWANAYIDFAASRGLIQGTSSTKFRPDGTLTQSGLVTALGRLAGIDPADYPFSGRFTDVPTDASYAPYAEWAVSAGIVNHTGKVFGPDTPVTREQLAIIMYQYADKLGYTLSSVREAMDFTDASAISAGMKTAVRAIQQAGMMSSKSGRLFAPRDKVTRAEAAAVLYRFAEMVINRSGGDGWGQNDAGRWSYYENGKPMTGWKQITDKWYCFDSDSSMYDGSEKEMSGKWYTAVRNKFWPAVPK
ncbi:leucine-rich repeat protein [Anaerolentibacter hominis]|uniref:leucine-rich repeat protein n=1 Tax=Anaerolentibacter hominis TaxID=3079009 RepID=UPI0031B84F8A